ncbi:ATP-binding cassette domain-containing protein [Streptomyces alkaliphilus]|uniref:ATP-binding cassette domain-containing protein n=1 Tax=Streptomyces alkaliphilus TaxID=1472722 RepID=UPI00117DB238|nr:ATP-binding cassette domain-containing protein [Streptomyces alkaliphilus]MQS09090.1 ATP-binding cassette domain-containing protein [Streptomyces alkaliphilus]
MTEATTAHAPPDPGTGVGAAIRAEGLRKRFRGHEALRGLDLRVRAGTVHGLLGPNGSGKTTTVRVLTGLLRADAGRALVCGHDVAREPERVRARIALTGQYAAVDETLSGRQNLVMFGRLAKLGHRRARRRAEELLEEYELTDAANRSAGTWSGGMRRRLDLAVSLVRVPEVLFLDEPTTGLDPRSRNRMWDAVRNLVAAGTTVLLTTQYLEEADRLAHRITVLDAGRVVAEGTPEQVKAVSGGDRLEVVVRDTGDLVGAVRLLARLGDGEPRVDREARRVDVEVRDRMTALSVALRELEGAGVRVEDIGTRRPGLDEAFLRLTGRPAASGAGAVTGTTGTTATGGAGR